MHLGRRREVFLSAEDGGVDVENWHLDKRIPIAIIMTIIVQTVTFVALGATWKAQTEARILSLEKSDNDRKGVIERLVVIEVQQRNISEQLNELKSTLRERRTN